MGVCMIFFRGGKRQRGRGTRDTKVEMLQASSEETYGASQELPQLGLG